MNINLINLINGINNEDENIINKYFFIDEQNTIKSFREIFYLFSSSDFKYLIKNKFYYYFKAIIYYFNDKNINYSKYILKRCNFKYSFDLISNIYFDTRQKNKLFYYLKLSKEYKKYFGIIEYYFFDKTYYYYLLYKYDTLTYRIKTNIKRFIFMIISK